MHGVLHLLEISSSTFELCQLAKLSGALPFIRICIADVKVQMQMHMQGEWTLCLDTDLMDVWIQCSKSKPSYEFHFEGLSNNSPSIDGLVQIQDVNPRI